MFNLQGKVALVTGAARGIGKEIAITLARHGVQVTAADIDAQALVEAFAAEGTIRQQVLDVTAPDSWAEAIDGIEQAFGRLDILVNNAGIMESRSFFDTSLEDFQRSQRINSESVFIGIKAAYPLIARTSETTTAGCSIINMSSIFGQIAGDMNSAYCASKGAVRMLTKALAVEFGRAKSRIRVNSVHPGGIDTALGRGGLQAMVDAGAIPDIASAEQMLAMFTPLGRFGQVDDIADVVSFLASDASKFMTGTELTVDGGFSII